MIPINELPDLEKEDYTYHGQSLITPIVNFNIQFELPVKILSPKTEYEFFGLLLVSMILNVPRLHLEKLTH